MAERICSLPECDTPIGHHGARGMCPLHYQRWCKHGDPKADVPLWRPVNTLACTVEGCEEPRRSLDLCLKHYTRVYRNGTTERLSQRVHPVICTIDGCDKPTKGKGWCSMHLARFYRNGHPTILRGYPIVEIVGYREAHKRVRDQHGLPAEYPCQHCSKPAQDWAYDHADPDERQSEHGPYSLDISRYLPLCRSCHTRFDKGRA